MKVLVIGGSRFVGPLLVGLLLKHRHNVTVFNRGNMTTEYPGEVKFVRGDRDEGFGLREKFDAVVDMCAYKGKQTETALRGLKFDFFLNFGTAAAYKQSEVFPLTEDSPIGIWPAWGEYNKGKVECEEVLGKSRIKYATIRPVYVLGPKNYCDRENFIYSRIRNSKPIIIPGNGQALNQFVFADEVAKAIILLVEKNIQGAFNVAGDEYITLVGLVRVMAEVLGKKARVRFNLEADGVRFREEEFPFSNENLVVSNKKIKKLGITFTPLADGLRRDYASYYSEKIGPVLL